MDRKYPDLQGISLGVSILRLLLHRLWKTGIQSARTMPTKISHMGLAAGALGSAGPLLSTPRHLSSHP